MPDIEYAFLADAAEARPGQKFAVIGGGVSRLGGPQFPLRHPHLALVCGLLVTAPELGREHELQFLLLTPVSLSASVCRWSSSTATCPVAPPGR